MDRISLERLQAMLDHAHKVSREEDCIRRLENRAIVQGLDNARRIHILSAWAGDRT